MSEQERVLLPDDVHPKKYRVTLTPDLTQCTFSGKAEIEIQIEKSTSRIVLHAAELELQSVELQQNGVARVPTKIIPDEKTETATFEFGESLATGPATLSVLFAGTLNDQMRGFYRSEYLVDGEKRTMAVTQF